MAAGGGSEPNLTPFIDLFSVLVCFLLMTAAWIQLESVQVQVEKKPKLNPDQSIEQPSPDEPEKPVTKLSLVIDEGKILARENERERSFRINGLDVYTPELESTLKEWRGRFDQKQVIVLHTQGKATYGQLIRLYDIVSKSGWPEVGINPY